MMTKFLMLSVWCVGWWLIILYLQMGALLADALSLNSNSNNNNNNNNNKPSMSQRQLLEQQSSSTLFIGMGRRDAIRSSILVWLGLETAMKSAWNDSSSSSAQAAPPIAIIAEELGYFPVQNRGGQVVYIPKKVSRKSTDQAIELAKRMRDKGISMYGAYWCPHCSRQKELFGREAWSIINYIECSPKGYGFQKGLCNNVDGYPTFKDKRGKINFSGERALEDLAKQVGFTAFDPSLEDEVPMVGTACRLR